MGKCRGIVADNLAGGCRTLFSRNWLGIVPGGILKDPCDRKINIMSSDCHLSFKWLLNFNGKPFRSFFPSDEKLSEVRWKKFFIEFYLWGEPC